MNDIKDILIGEIDNLKELQSKYINKQIDILEFINWCNKNGIISEDNGKTFCVTLKISCGIISFKELSLIYEIANKYNLQDIYFTTKQNIKIKNIQILDLCDILSQLIDNNIVITFNYYEDDGNVFLSPLTGVDKKELFDSTFYALLIDSYLSQIKLNEINISFCNVFEELTNIKYGDFIFIPSLSENEDKCFNIFNVNKDKTLNKLDNKIKADDILPAIRNLLSSNKNESIPQNKNDEMYFKQYANCKYKQIKKQGIETPIKHHRLIEQKNKNLYSVYVHFTSGKVKIDQFNILINGLKGLNNDFDMRLSGFGGIYIRNLNGKEAEMLLEETKFMGGDTLLEQSVVYSDQSKTSEMVSLLEAILDYYNKQNRKSDALPRLYICESENTSSLYPFIKIAFCIKEKEDRGNRLYTLYIGNNSDGLALPQKKGELIFERIPIFLHELGRAVDNSGLAFDSYLLEKEYEFNLLLNKYLV